MPADIYHLVVPGQDDGFPHLHVVVIDIDADQRLCIPAYDASGPKVTELTRALHRLGIYEGVGWIEIDNKKEATFKGHWTGKLANWVAYRIRRIQQQRLGKPIGELSDRGLGKIIECVLKLHAQRPASTLTEDELKAVKKIANRLGVAIPKGL